MRLKICLLRQVTQTEGQGGTWSKRQTPKPGLFQKKLMLFTMIRAFTLTEFTASLWRADAGPEKTAPVSFSGTKQPPTKWEPQALMAWRMILMSPASAHIFEGDV